jgi:hypothetical protein
MIEPASSLLPAAAAGEALSEQPVLRKTYLQRIGYFFDFLNIPKVNESGKTVPLEQRFDLFCVFVLAMVL